MREIKKDLAQAWKEINGKPYYIPIYPFSALGIILYNFIEGESISS